MRRPIENNASPVQAVYEPFSGSGTTIIAAASSRFNGTFTRGITRMGAPVRAGLHTTLPMASGRSSTNSYSLSARPKKPSTSRTKPFRSRRWPTRLKRRLNEGSRASFWFPAQPEPHVREARCDPSRRLLFDWVGSLGQYERFSLVGIAAMNGEGARRDIYIGISPPRCGIALVYHRTPTATASELREWFR